MIPWLHTAKCSVCAKCVIPSDLCIVKVIWKQYCAQTEETIKLEIRKPDFILHLSLFAL